MRIFRENGIRDGWWNGMSRFKFKADFNGYAALRKSPKVSSECRKYATQIQEIAGPGFDIEERQYQKRGAVIVKPATDKDYFRNLNGNILEKAWRSVRE